MRKISSRSNVIKKAQALTPTSAADIVYAIAGGDKSGAMTGALSDLIRKNPAEFSKAFSTLNAAEKSIVVDRMSALGFRPAGTTMPISYRPGTSTLTRAVPPVSGPTTLPSGTSPVIPPTNTPTTMPPGTPTVSPPIRPTTMPPGTPTVTTGPRLVGNNPPIMGQNALIRAPQTALAPAAGTGMIGGGAAGGEAAAVGAAGVGAGTVAIAAAAAALLAYPKIAQLLYGGIDEDMLTTGNPSDALRTKLIETVKSYWEPIIACDVAENDYGGDLSDIADYENARIIKNYADILHASTTSPRMRDYALKEITFDNIARQLAEAEDTSGGSWAARFIVGGREDRSLDKVKSSPCVAKGAADFTGWVAQYIAAIKERDPVAVAQTGGGGGGQAPSGGGTGGGGSIPTGTRGEALDYVGASKIMIEKGFLDSVQTDWTPEFDAGFRGFIDAATRGADNIPDSNLSSGQTWGEVAGELGFTPDARGAIVAVKRLAKFIGKGATPSAIPDASPAGPKPKGEAPVVSGKENILAQMVGILYNERLVEGGGFLSYEKKQTQSLVDAIGGGGPSGFQNAAKVLMKRNPQLASVVPDELNMPVTKKTIKGTDLLPAFKMVQQTIHDIYEAANPGIINPGKEKATENVKKYLGTMAGGSWKEGSYFGNRFVKLAEERRERIRREIEANLTPAEKAAMRRLRMRGA